METTEGIKKIQRTIDKSLLTGMWRLKYVLVNRMGLGGFSGRMLTVYTDPLTGASRWLYDLNGQKQNGYMIEKQVTIFDPENDMQHRNELDWLIGHPDVWVEQDQTKLHDRYMQKKNENSRIKLVNLDHQAIENLDEEDYIDKLVGRIVAEGGKEAIGIKKLRFILAKLNFEYYDAKYITNPAIEKAKLRKRLKDFVRRGMKEANKVQDIIDNLQDAQFEYEIKEMVRHEVLHISNGMYKYESVPIGIATESVIKYFLNNPDFYAEVTKALYDKLRIESKEE